MPLAKDHSTLPAAAKPEKHGRKPDPSPTFLQPYLDHLAERQDAEGERPHAVEDTRFRHSMAGSCSRAIAYHALGVPASDPMDLAGIVVTSNGTAKHDEIQAVLADVYGDALQVEVPCKVPELDGSGSADGVLCRDGLREWCRSCGHQHAVHSDEGCNGQTRVGPGDEHDGGDFAPCTCSGFEGHETQRVCWEHKNVGGFAFKMAVGERGDAQGPKWAHLVQAALNAKAQDADLVVITYMTWEAISVNIAQRKGFDEAGRVCAQWTYTREEWEPLADAEIARVSKILARLDEGVLPGRSFPDPELPVGNVVTHPPSGGWEHKAADGTLIDTGTFWACGYCRWQTVCSETKPGRQPISEVAVTLGIAEREVA